jgi:hypothetical protein
MAVLRTAAGGAAPALWDALSREEDAGDFLLPHVREAVLAAEADVAVGLAEPDAKPRSPENILRRSLQIVYVRALEASLADAAGTPLAAAAWQAAISAAHTELGGEARAEKPKPCDYGALADAAGWARGTRDDSERRGLYPYRPRPSVDGHLAVVDVAGLLRSLVSARGGMPDNDDPIWTILDHLYAHEPTFVAPAVDGREPKIDGGAALEARIRASAGPLRLGKAPAAVDPRVMAQLEANASVGVLRELSAAEINDKRFCAVISPVKPVFKGPLKPSAAAAAALEAGYEEGGAALAAAVAADADAIVAAAHARLDALPGVAPHVVLEQVLGEFKAVEKVRACVDGHALGEFIHSASFQYVTFDELLAECVHGATVAKADGRSFFYVVPYAERAKRLLCIEYGGRVWVQERLAMGYKDSPALASALSALVCEIVTLRTGAFIRAYIDDFITIGVDGVTESTQIVLREVLASANIPEATEKAACGTDTVVLGRVFDTVRDAVYLTRRATYGYMMHAAIVRRLLAPGMPRAVASITAANISSLAGKLGWWARATWRGRCHVGAVIKAATHGASVAALRGALVADLSWWEAAWTEGKLAPELILDATRPTVLVRVQGGGADEDATAAAARGGRAVASDAGDPGGGAIWGAEALYIQWRGDEAHAHSDWREARVSLAVLERWGAHFGAPAGEPPRRVLLLMDNLGNVYSINRGRARSARVTALISSMYDLAERHNFVFAAAWVPREVNLAADAISKCATAGEARAVCARLGKTFVEHAEL